MQSLLKALQQQFPQLQFVAGDQFCWSPETSEIFYKDDFRASGYSPETAWSLLHETGHALLEHKNYIGDFHLLKLEIAAWDKAREVAASQEITIDENHIQDCLDTYRDWLYKRSICPNCHTKCLQQDDYIHYRCFNCHTTWKVTASRLCRAYRATKNIAPASLAPAVFHLQQ